MIRVFARKTKWTPTDDLAFYDEPPLFDLPDLPVAVSVTFTWDIKHGHRLLNSWRQRWFDGKTKHYPWIGGPAFNHPGGKFIPGRFVKRGVIITSRGCPKRCPWCYAWQREGNVRELQIYPGYIVQDNNLLACSRGHIEKVFAMLAQQPMPASFPGGLDIDFLNEWHVGLLRDLQKAHRLGTMFVAFDTEKSLDKLPMAKELLGEFHIDRRRAYVLIGFEGDTLEQAESRLERVYDAGNGFLPFAMLFDGKKDDPEWRALQRKWCRPAAYRKNLTTNEHEER